MKRILIAGALGTLLAGIAPAYACQFNTDCGIGARCIKQPGALYGICAGGVQPGNQWDQRPVRDLYGGSTGNTCSFSYQCGPGHKCVKSGLHGVCVRSR